MSTTTTSRRRMPLAVFVLGLTVFSLGTTEFMIAGLLPELAADLRTSLPGAGSLISLFALGVVVGAPTLTLLSSRVPRKATLLGLLAVFVVGEVLAALAPSFGVLMLARVITAVAHGAFFGIGAVVAAGLVEPERRARAIAVMFGGLTIATIAGVPLGAFIGQHAGWRATFWAVAALGLISLAGIAALVPHQPRPEQPTPISAEFAGFTNPRLWLALATTVLSQAALYVAYTYISPLLTEVTGFPAASVPLLLLVYGLGTVGGTWLGGRLADRALMPTLCAGLGLLAVMLALFTLAARTPVAMIVVLFAFGVASFLINPALQTRVMTQAERAPTLASATNISAFNIGNALGPWLGGLGLAAGLGYLAPSQIGAALALGALAVALGAGALERAPRHDPATPRPEQLGPSPPDQTGSPARRHR